MLELKKRGIDCEEVPGITSAIAIPAEAGIPVTYRKISRSVHIITGHTAEDKAAEDFGVLAKLKGTLVFLMGLDKLEEITDALIAEGKDWNTPAAVISGGNAVNPVILRGTLKDISEKTKKKSVQSPVVIVIGKVAAMDLQNYHYMAAR